MLHCTFENGNIASLRHVTVDALLVQDRKLLLVKRSPKLSEGGKWALVGGYVERNETVKKAIAREVMEETGYQAQQLKLFTIRDQPDRTGEDRQNISFIFTGTVGQKLANADWEIDAVQWFNLDELPAANTIAFDHGVIIELYKKSQQSNQAQQLLSD